MDYPISIWIVNSNKAKVTANKLLDSEISAIKDTVDTMIQTEVERLMKISNNSNKKIKESID